MTLEKSKMQMLAQIKTLKGDIKKLRKLYSDTSDEKYRRSMFLKDMKIIDIQDIIDEISGKKKGGSVKTSKYSKGGGVRKSKYNL